MTRGEAMTINHYNKRCAYTTFAEGVEVVCDELAMTTAVIEPDGSAWLVVTCKPHVEPMVRRLRGCGPRAGEAMKELAA